LIAALLRHPFCREILDCLAGIESRFAEILLKRLTSLGASQ
jgi:hypothetical protein